MNTSLTKLTSQLRLILAASVAAGSVVATPALAQEESNAKDVEKIAVVGTRAAPRSIGDSAVPIDIISEEEFVNQGSTDMQGKIIL